MNQPQPPQSRLGCYFAAMAIALLALVQSLDVSFHRSVGGDEISIATKAEPPVHLLVPELVALGWLLGLPISPSLMAALFKQNQ